MSLRHSCQPNIGIAGKNKIVALCKIRRGAELTIDDSTTEADLRWHKKCSCGAKSCRGLVRSVQFLPEEIYKKCLPYVSDYIQKVRRS